MRALETGLRALGVPEIETRSVAGPVCSSRDTHPIARTCDFEMQTCSNEFVFVRCGGCGLVYLENRPVPAALSLIYPSGYAPYQFHKVLGPMVRRLKDGSDPSQRAVARQPRAAARAHRGCGLRRRRPAETAARPRSERGGA